MLADRYLDMNNEEHMMFLLSETGCTKTVRKCQWGNCVSCVATIGVEDHDQILFLSTRMTSAALLFQTFRC